MVLLTHGNAPTESLPVPLIFLDWSSRRPERMCRSSLPAEAQSAANAVDMLDLVKEYISL